MSKEVKTEKIKCLTIIQTQTGKQGLEDREELKHPEF
jgi:hypothetical protein